MKARGTVDPARSALMKRVKRERTAPEERVAVILRELGIRTRRNVRSLPGSPDFANKSRRFAIFVNGCFWHGHVGCRFATTPKSNRTFWLAKLDANRARDARKLRELRRHGFKVITLWECQSVAKQTAQLRRIDSRSAH